MSGKNPFWNYDYNAAQRNREIVDSYQQANEARLDSQQSQFEASMANDRVSRIQMQLNIFYRTINRLQEEWPDQKDHILDEIQRQRDYCNHPEYREKWWNAVSKNNIGESVLAFPYPQRELKKKP